MSPDGKPLQGYPFVRIVIPFVIGIFAGDSLFAYFGSKVLPYVAASLLLPLLILLFTTFRRYRKPKPWLFGVTLYVVLFLLGSLLTGLHHRSLDVTFPNEECLYEGRIASYGAEKPKTWKYTVIIHPEEVKTIVYFRKDSLSARFVPGNEVKFTSWMSRPRAFRDSSSSSFDYPQWLYRHGIVAQGYSRRFQLTVDDTELSVSERFLAWRNKLISIYKEYGLTGQTGAVLSALTLADKSQIDEELRQDYSLSGASHVLALSGLHLAILYGLLNTLLFATPNRLRWRRLCQVPIVITVWLFTMLVGCPVSLLRASIMCTLCSCAIIAERPPVSFNNVALAAFFILLFNPFQLFDVGFQLSFAAVFSIILFYPHLHRLLKFHSRVGRWCWSLVCVSFVAQLGVAPLVSHYFGRLPLWFLPTNFVVMILVPVILALALAFLALPFIWLRILVAPMLGWLVGVMNRLLAFIASLPHASVNVSLSWWDVWACYAFLLLFLFSLHKSKAKAIITILLALLFAMIIHLGNWLA